MAFVSGILAGSAVTIIVGLAIWMRVSRQVVQLERRTAESERLAELGMLTGGLAHEIKNPLSTLQLNLQLLREDLEARVGEGDRGRDSTHQSPDARMLRRLRSVSNEADRLREILDDFLRYAGRIEPELERLDLRALAEEMIDFVSPQAQVARVRLVVEAASPDPPPVSADAKLLKQAMLNLLLNAIQHSEPGDTVRIHLSTESPRHRGDGDQEVRIDVIDEGTGIPPDARDRIFEPYFSRRKGGTGLGLPMTRRIVEAHRGRLEVASTPGGGATFSVFLPAIEAPERVVPLQRVHVAL